MDRSAEHQQHRCGTKNRRQTFRFQTLRFPLKSVLLIRVPEHAATAERDAVRQRADAILSRLHDGAEFAQLAREHSQDPVSAPRGGDMGFIAKGEMDSSFERAAFALSPGQVSAVVATPYGSEIIKLVDRRGEGYQPLAEVQDRIRSELLAAKRQSRQAAFVEQLRFKAKMVEPLAP